jgi:hypothetical protein
VSDRLLALDPGLRGCGVAVFENGVLSGAAYLANRHTCLDDACSAAAMARTVALWAAGATSIVAEWPRVYAGRIRAGTSKANPNDLLALAGVVSGVAAVLDLGVVTVAPSEWKGQMKKEVCKERVLAKLSLGELAAFERGTAGQPASKLHNAWDAVGIGLHRLDRFARRTVHG